MSDSEGEKKQNLQSKDYTDLGVTPKRPVEMKEVKTGYLSSSLFDPRVIVLAVIVLASAIFWTESGKVLMEINQVAETLGQIDLVVSLQKDVYLLVGVMTFFIVGLIYYFSSSTPVYLIDFSVLQPDDKYKIPHDLFMLKTRSTGFFTKENEDFQEKILHRSGLGENTYFPPGIMCDKPELTLAKAREEAEYVITKCLEDLFSRTNIKPTDVDMLIVNCSLFNPTPSLTAMAINKFGMRENLRNYNLSGMGCSAGVISLDLVKDLLQVHPNSLAVVISTENITQNWYKGNDKGMLLSNCIFRMGGAAILVSNRRKDYFRAKYQLLHTVRTQKARSDEAYKSVFQEEDADGKVGVRLSKDLIKVVGDALKTNLTVLGPLVLPAQEQIKFFVNLIMRKTLKMKVPAYTPDFKTAFQHYCIHAGGRAVIDGLEQNLKLEPTHVLPSRATLYRVGNTSSSSIWYELAYTEQTGRLKKGDKVWQIAFGSGFKCNSAVWKALRNINDKARRPFWDNFLTGLSEEYQQVIQKDMKMRM